MRIAAGNIGWFLLGLICLSWQPAAASLYQWTDADGVRHFSNRPPPDTVESSILTEEIPYDPETDSKRRLQEDALLQEREADETRRRLEEAERKAEAARRRAEAAQRKAEALEKDLQEREENRSYGVYYPRRHPGHRPPGWHPPHQRPPGQRPPAWRPKPKPHAKPHPHRGQQKSPPPQGQQAPRGNNR
ncbi:MAG: DUF4124 domain-containing protein [Desulfobacterales bacterium]|jgi:hypothetical protein